MRYPEATEAWPKGAISLWPCGGADGASSPTIHLQFTATITIIINHYQYSPLLLRTDIFISKHYFRPASTLFSAPALLLSPALFSTALFRQHYSTALSFRRIFPLGSEGNPIPCHKYCSTTAPVRLKRNHHRSTRTTCYEGSRLNLLFGSGGDIKPQQHC